MGDKLIYYNGKFVKSKIYYNLLKDRGFNFGESVYEVIRFCDGIFICFDDHIDRLEKGLSELKIENPLKRDKWKEICLRLANQYGKRECIVYIQVTGGSAEREHFVKEKPKPNYFIFCQDIPYVPEQFNLILFPEIRWKWAHLKTTNLLANVIVKNLAKEKGFDEALFFDKDGAVKEGSSTNIFYVKDRVFFTPSLNGILPGVTRKRFIEFLKTKGYRVVESKVMIWDLFEADGVFLTGTSTELKPVKSINKINIKIFPTHKELEKE
ncbi:MAG: aminotransferase class IV, partial [Candidatus Hydrothermales bacterium]